MKNPAQHGKNRVQIGKKFREPFSLQTLTPDRRIQLLSKPTRETGDRV
jgi:hypothetical protein